jgi:hypothetical protein
MPCILRFIFFTFTFTFTIHRNTQKKGALTMGRDNSVDTATRYTLDGPRIESWWEGEVLRTRPDWPWGLPSLLYNGYGSFPAVKRLGPGFDNPPSSSAEVKERAELHFYSPYGPVIGWTISLALPIYLFLDDVLWV